MSSPVPDTTSSGTTGSGNGNTDSGTAAKKKFFKKQQQQSGVSQSHRNPKFEGRVTDLKGFIYDFTSNKNADQYTTTTKEIVTYIGGNYKDPDVIITAMQTFTAPTFTPPAEPQDPTNRVETKRWEWKCVRQDKEEETFKENNVKLYHLIWGQCTNAMQQKIEGMNTFATIRTESNGLSLLQAIKNTAYNFDDKKFIFEVINEASCRLMNFRQGQHLSNHQYYEQFCNLLEVYNHCCGRVEPDPKSTEYCCRKMQWDIDTLTDHQKEAIVEMGWANLFFIHADSGRYGGLIAQAKNDFLTGRNSYPSTINNAYERLQNWTDPNAAARKNNNSNDGVSFTTGSTSDASNNKKNKKGKKNKDHITCFHCDEKGHYSNECPHLEEEDKEETTNVAAGESTNATQLLNNGINEGEFDDSVISSFQFLCNGTSLTTNHSYHIPKSWILLDNQSTVDVFCNKQLLTDIRDTQNSMNIHCNAGTATTTKQGTFKGYGDVWYHPTGIANILSLSNVRAKGFKIEYNNERNCFIICKADGKQHIFVQSPRGLYFLDTAVAQQGTTFITTVSDNKSKYSHRDYLRAIEAKKLLATIGRPSMKTFIRILEQNLIPNCPVTRRDAIIAEAIFGPDLGSLKGKTVQRPSQTVLPVLNDLPWEIMEMYRDVTLTVDILYVNKIMFVVTRSRHIFFSTVEMVGNRKPDTIFTCIKNAKNIYTKRGFRVTHILTDGEFECLRGALSGIEITLNVASNAEHVPEIERYIRTLKERTRCMYNMLPFNRMPDRLIIEMVYASNFWLNCFPSEIGISNVLSPRAIVTGASITFDSHCKIEFGSYVQVHEEHDNTMDARTVGAIALRPTGNAQGGHFFYSLKSGKVLNRNHWTDLPMPAEVIDRVHVLARRKMRGLQFYDRDNLLLPFDDLEENEDDDDSTYNPEGQVDNDNYENDEESINDNEHHPEDNIDSDNDDDIDSDDDEDTDDDDDDDNDDILNDQVDPNAEDGLVNENPQDEPEDNIEEDDAEAINGNEGVEAPIDEEEQIPEDEVEQDLDAEMTLLYGPRNANYDLRARRPRDYRHMHTNVLEHTAMTQYSVKKGLQIFGDDGVEAVLTELKQLHDRKVIEPVKPSSLTSNDKHAALQYLMFLKQKRCGKIKGRGCADGRKQRATMTKEQVSSPTVAIESVLLSCTIDAQEKRKVATVDIPGAFMHADMDEVLHIKIEGAMADLLIRLDPNLYEPHVEVYKGKKVLYLLLRKALYGTLQAALLFWEKLSGVLTSWGFKINPYDTCVANKDINGSQCTILWHVDDLKISHIDDDVISGIIEDLTKEFGIEAPLSVHRGMVHDYLGMNIDYSIDGKVQIRMVDYINNILMEMPDEMQGVSPTPAANHLFEVNPDADKLEPDKKEFFHHVVAQLLFLCKRARPDIQTAIAFLCTRVQHADSDDYKKLIRVIRYLRGSLDLPLTLEGHDINIMKWWVDASYGVHPDMRSHTGGVMSLGKGAIYGVSTRQKLTTKSSTEAELVGVADVLPQILWTRYFLEAQGYTCDDTILYQDNKSAILLEENGRGSSSKRTRHINIRYYFITDRIKNGEVKVEYCPTEMMLADFFTKPLQGKLFQKFRNFIMNCEPGTENAEQVHRSVLNTVLSTYMTDDGFMLVTRKYRNTGKETKTGNGTDSLNTKNKKNTNRKGKSEKKKRSKYGEAGKVAENVDRVRTRKVHFF